MSVVDIKVSESRVVGKVSTSPTNSKMASVISIHKKKDRIAFENAKKNLKAAADKLDW
ncbi:hypothetical protein [Pseudoalteromonas sp. McH1-42]|uniref:hypothetical protein n=1 Tax=Pseudoalteromonas sp. McH1-42 TaxID=2917752 RepID=UPI001EF4E0B2|nr:hypothetical protein [Pseudoalteromonas sp. McH1-42]MCG7563800.1 hypothetical protein [Pseudoalteromonas sp. McH1-42]